MSTEFAELGFVNYQTSMDSSRCQGGYSPGLVVQVATRNFDYIILDECVSTFLHSSTAPMNKRVPRTRSARTAP
jgi:hypothetical protein